jgi:hypothetical protein
MQSGCHIPKRRRLFARPNIGRKPGSAAGTEGGAGRNVSQTSRIGDWNAAVQRMWEGGQHEALPVEEMWEAFLWEHSPTRSCPIKVLMNACHLAGLVLARYIAAAEDPDCSSLAHYFGESSRLALHEKVAPKDFTLRQLRDTVQNVQILWDGEGAVANPGTRPVLDACFHRFGELASVPHPLSVMNDGDSIEDFGCNSRLNNVPGERCID